MQIDRRIAVSGDEPDFFAERQGPGARPDLEFTVLVRDAGHFNVGAIMQIFNTPEAAQNPQFAQFKQAMQMITMMTGIDPERRGYPKTDEGRNELWRRLVHFQMSNYLSAGEKLPEAKRLLAHRYELRTKRFRELPQWEIYSIFPDATGSERLTNDPAVDTDPAWSPDGRRIAFTSNRTENDDIWLMSEDGSGLGLTLAQTFVQQHDGLIEVESRPGHTEFQILLPLDTGSSATSI